jgi:hypothetical protein
MDSKTRIINMFQEKFNKFTDSFHPPNHIPDAENSVICHFIPCIIKKLNELPDDIFGNQDVIERAIKVKDFYVASTVVDNVIDYIIKVDEEKSSVIIDKYDLPKIIADIIVELADFSHLKELVDKHHYRFIREMAIEYDQVYDGTGEQIIEQIKNNEKSVEEAFELLKALCYSTWRNERDFVYIARSPDEEYIAAEYAKLSI